jgi:hypothetical protein
MRNDAMTIIRDIYALNRDFLDKMGELETAVLAQQTPNTARAEMPQSCAECWVVSCQFDYNGVGCRSQVGAARSSVA